MLTQVLNVQVSRIGLLPTIDVVQGDSGRVLECRITDFVIPSGSTARIYAQKPSGTRVYNNATIDGNMVSVELTTQMLAEIGKTMCQVEVINSDERVTSFDFALKVVKSRVDESAIESENEFGVLEGAIDKAQTATTNANKAASTANAAAWAANTAADSANTAAVAANTATANADDAREEIEQKLAAGDFNANITVGSTTTGAPGTQASVTNSGTNMDVVLDFTIPRGDTGGVENPDTVINSSTSTSQNVPTTEAVYNFGKAPIETGSYMLSPAVYGGWGNWSTSLSNGGYLVLSTFQFSISQIYALRLVICNDRVSQAEYRILVHYRGNGDSAIDINPLIDVSCLTSRLEDPLYNYALDYSSVPLSFLSDSSGNGHLAFGDGSQVWRNTQVKITDISLLGTADDDNWKIDFRNDWGFTCVENINNYKILKTLQPSDIHFFAKALTNSEYQGLMNRLNAL